MDAMSATVKDRLKKHFVNHVALVIDKSGSMRGHAEQLVRVVDEFVKGLAEESDRLGHETGSASTPSTTSSRTWCGTWT